MGIFDAFGTISLEEGAVTILIILTILAIGALTLGAIYCEGLACLYRG